MKNVHNKFFDQEVWDNVLQSNKDLMEDFLLELKQNKKSDGSISQYKNDLRILHLWLYKNLNNRDVLTVTKKEFRKYSLYLTEECHLSSARHNRMLSAVRSMLTYAENDDDLDYEINTAKKVKGLGKEAVREIFFLTDEQILKLKNKLIERKEYQKSLLLMLAYDSAGRRNELAQVSKLSFLDEKKNNTNKVIGKRRKQFSLLYFSGTKECAKLWLEQRGEDNIDSLWVMMDDNGNKKEINKSILYDWFIFMRKLLSEMEGKEIDFNPHSIRHSSLTNYGNSTHYVLKELGVNGFPIEKLKLLAHHESIDTTQGYLPDTSNDELEGMFNIKIE
jgi:site-specific recombinase XerD